MKINCKTFNFRQESTLNTISIRLKNTLKNKAFVGKGRWRGNLSLQEGGGQMSNIETKLTKNCPSLQGRCMKTY